MTEPLNGVVVIDKPVGPTSFAMVHRARVLTGARKVGHGGTLDPLASGVLPLCFGEATKLAQFLLDADKEYEAVIVFGAETDTHDAGGQVTAQQSAAHLTSDDIQRALTGFRGEQAQVPPMYSALKRGGRPLYAYARAGETVERQARVVCLHALELQAFWSEPVPSAKVSIHCSKGTYVRSLARDLGRVLGTGAHLAALRRTRSGPFGVGRAIAPEALGNAPVPVVSPADALAHLPTVVVADEVARDLIHGKVVSWGRARGDVPAIALVDPSPHFDRPPPLIRILGAAGHLLAVAPGGTSEEPIKTMRVFCTPDWDRLLARSGADPTSVAGRSGSQFSV